MHSGGKSSTSLQHGCELNAGNSESRSEGLKSKKQEGMFLNDETEWGFIGKDCAYIQSTIILHVSIDSYVYSIFMKSFTGVLGRHNFSLQSMLLMTR